MLRNLTLKFASLLNGKMTEMTELRAQFCFLNNQHCPNFVKWDLSNHFERCTPIILLGTTFDNFNRWKIRQCVPDVAHKYSGADLGGIKRGLRHGQIFEILICLSIETKKSV